MKIFIHSCHAGLEYDQARMLTDMGHEVSGIFDIGSEQKPKIKGITDKNGKAGNADLYLLHQCEDFPERSADYATKYGKPVITMAFGQGGNDSHAKMATVLKDIPNTFLCAYSETAVNIYKKLGCSTNDKVHFIRFGKRLTEFGPWSGVDHSCLVACNSIHKRGDACGWPIVAMLRQSGINVKLVGHETEEVGGLGLVSDKELKDLFRQAYVAFVPGTVPAQYTLTMMEAAASGTPIIAWDSGCGLGDENLGLHTVKTLQEAVAAIKLAMDDDLNRAGLHGLSVNAAKKHFDEKKVVKKWGAMLDSLCT